MEKLKDYIKKMYNGISPAGSNEDFVNSIIRKAEVMNRIDSNKMIKNDKANENIITENVNIIDGNFYKRSGRSSLTVAACLALSLVIGTGVFLTNTDFLSRPESQYTAESGITDTAYETNTLRTDYKLAFDNVYGNAELLHDALNVPKYEVLENTFENIDFKVVGVVGDDNGMVSIVIDAIAKNGFKFEAGDEYRYAGLIFGIDNTYSPWEFNLFPSKDNFNQGYDNGVFNIMEYLSITPEKLTFILDGSTCQEYVNASGKKAIFYLEEIWYWIPDPTKEYIKPESKDPNHEISIQEDTNIIAGRVKLEVDLDYGDVGAIELDVNKAVELDLNSRKNNSETVSSIVELVESILLTPMSVTINTLNNISSNVYDESDIFYSFGLKMKNGNIFTSNTGYAINGVKSYDSPRTKDFENRGYSFYGDSEENSPFTSRKYRSERYSFQNLINLSEVESIILGDLEIPVNVSDNDEVTNEEAAEIENDNNNAFADAFGNYDLLDGMTNTPEYEVIENTFENIDQNQ